MIEQEQFLNNSSFSNKNLYISTTLPYVNSHPHIGHAFEFVMADFLKRYYNLLYNLNWRNTYIANSNEAFLNTGIDEHGQKIAQKAEELNLKTQEYCDKMSQDWINFCGTLKMDYDSFYRTSSNTHKDLVQEYLFNIRKILYSKSYTGKYCVGCESFKTDKEIKNNQCEYHPGLELKDISETNIFFPLTKFRGMNLESILVDETMRNELNSIIENCGDLSITREMVSWGIPVPFSEQTIYVWFEALLNYIFAIGYKPSLLNFTEFSQRWKNSLIICGRDNLKFQAYILPAILKANGINPPKKILVHGMILDKDGNKMSKSLGNVINPNEQINKYGLNAFIYYLLAGLNTFQNSCYSEEELINKFNNDACNNLGNLISRLTTIIERDFSQHFFDDIFDMGIEQNLSISGGIYKNFIDIKSNSNGVYNSISNLKDSDFIKKVDAELIKAHTEIQINFNIKNAFTIINNLVSEMNRYFTNEKPYNENSENRLIVITELLYALRKVYVFYVAAMPSIDKEFALIFAEPGKRILFDKIDVKKK